MAYDNQAPGWYLLNPEADGAPPGGEAGGVTNVKSKEGYGIMSSILSVANDQFGTDPIVEAARDLSESVSTKFEKKSESEEMDNPIHTASPKVAPSPKIASTSPTSASPAGAKKIGGTSGGGRAAALRVEMAQSGVLNEQSAQEKLQRADQIATLQSTVTQLESRVEKMEGSMKQMQGRITELESQKGCACTIS
jgi:uncharacterized coiled-coil protein SlyX